jgi:hypothetical protein
MLSDYKCTMMNPHCEKWSDEILENENEQMSQFCLEAGLSLEKLHSQPKIEMTYAHKAWEVGEPMIDEKRFDNITQTRHFYENIEPESCQVMQHQMRSIPLCSHEFYVF